MLITTKSGSISCCVPRHIKVTHSRTYEMEKKIIELIKDENKVRVVGSCACHSKLIDSEGLLLELGECRGWRKSDNKKHVWCQAGVNGLDWTRIVERCTKKSLVFLKPGAEVRTIGGIFCTGDLGMFGLLSAITLTKINHKPGKPNEAI